MVTQRQQLEAGIDALERQRPALGDDVVDAALAALRAKLAALPADDEAGETQVLRQVTVLFADMVGSTALSRRLDPEDTQSVFDGVLARCTTLVEAHGGRVLNYAGDALLAVFGAAEAREDDAERTVHAGLALLAEARRSAEQIRVAHGHAGFDLRVGIHTGGVLLGGGIDGDATVHGTVVHLAARMEQTAPPGGLRISHETWRHVRGAFDVQVQPPLAVKGSDEAFTTYLVLRPTARSFRAASRGIEGLETPLVGRDAELAQLQRAFAALIAEPAFRLVTVVGEAGLGKSRLVHEFERWARAQPQPFELFHGRAQPPPRTQPYGLLRDLFAWRFQIADSDAPDAARAKFEHGIRVLLGASGERLATEAHPLGHLIGLDFGDSAQVQALSGDPQQLRQRGFHVAAQLFRSLPVPALVLLDDVHWADGGSLDFIDEVAGTNRDVATLVVALARPELAERRADWGHSATASVRIALSALDAAQSRELALALLQRLDAVPEQLRERLTAGAEGNPFYMEELVKMLIDEGAIRTGTGSWQLVPERLHGTALPTTLTGVLQARLASLSGSERRALQHAAVIGPVFWDHALQAVDAGAILELPALVRRDLLVQRAESAFEGRREYAFRHHLMHQAAYETLLKRHRRAAHGRAATWFAEQVEHGATQWLQSAAEHFEKAGERHAAMVHYLRAAEDAAPRYAHETVQRSVAHALDLADAGDLAVRWQLHALRERDFDMLGQRAEQAADLATLDTLAETLGDPLRLADAAWRRCDLAYRTGDFAGAATHARRCIALAADAAPAAPLALRATARLVGALNRLGEGGSALALGRQGLARSRALGLRALESLFLNSLSIVTAMQGDAAGSLALDLQHLALCRELGNRRDESNGLSNVGGSYVQFGAHALARPYLDEALALMRSIGNRPAQANVLFNLSMLELREGDAQAALANALVALEIARGTGDREAELFSWFSAGQAELALGRATAARESFERSRELAETENRAREADAIAGLARADVASCQLTRALQGIEALLARLEDGDTFEGAESPVAILLTCHRVLAMHGDARADMALERAYARLQAQAASIGDAALRQSFLSAVPENRETTSRWAERHARPA